MTYSIEDICRKMLDNANLSIDLSVYPRVVLQFLVQGSVGGNFWEVRFDCGQVIKLNIGNDSDIGDDGLHLVLEVSVASRQKQEIDAALQGSLFGQAEDTPVWVIHVYGDMVVDLVCTEFSYSTTELSPVEYEARFA